MNELFTQEDFIAAKEFARIECSDEMGKTLMENIGKTLLLVSNISPASSDELIDNLAEPYFFIDCLENEISKKRTEITPEQGLSLPEQEKLKINASYFRLS